MLKMDVFIMFFVSLVLFLTFTVLTVLTIDVWATDKKGHPLNPIYIVFYIGMAVFNYFLINVYWYYLCI